MQEFAIHSNPSCSQESSLTSDLDQLPQRSLLAAGFITYLGHVSEMRAVVLCVYFESVNAVLSYRYLLPYRPDYAKVCGILS